MPNWAMRIETCLEASANAGVSGLTKALERSSVDERGRSTLVAWRRRSSSYRPWPMRSSVGCSPGRRHGSSHGSPSQGPKRPIAERRHVLRFDVAPETFALFREAMIALRRRTELMLDDDSALLLMARHVLGGPNDTGRASYQIGFNVCRGR